MTVIQAVIFNKEMYDTARCRRWLMKHKLFPIKRVHETTNWLRYRIREPDYNSNEYRTKQISNGIKIVVSIPFFQMYAD